MSTKLLLFAEVVSPIPIVLGLCALVSAFGLAYLRGRVRETTLLAPWYWAGASLAVLYGVEIWLALLPHANWHSHLRYAAAASTFWPLMAQLGAKRPQDRAWQFVVVSLWVVLLLPAGEGLLHSSDTLLTLPPAWSVFVLGLIVLGLVNGLPTRRWPTSLAAAAGRFALFSPVFPWDSLQFTRSNSFLPVVGMTFLAAAIVLEAMRPAKRTAARSIDRVWLDFRDAFGLLWALRVAERFNSASRQLRWGVRLRWHGLDQDPQHPAVEMTPELQATVRQNLETLLRRFVSDEWFDSRWKNRLDSIAETR